MKLPIWLKILIPVGGAAFLAGILLATPYENSINRKLVDPATQTGPMHLSLVLKAGNIKITGGKEFKIWGDSWGHGVPTSKIATTFRAVQQPNGIDSILYHERMSGRFSEVNQDLVISVPWHRVKSLSLDIENCEVELMMGRISSLIPITLSKTETKELFYKSESGRLIIKSIPSTFAWKDEADKKEFGRPNDRVKKGNPIIDVEDSFDGEIQW